MFFLYHRKSRPTGSVLARALGLHSGETTDAIPNGSWRRQNVLIRWGNRSGYLGTSGAERTVNGIQGLNLASDKLRTLQVLRDAGVRVPDFSTDPTDLEYPFLGRKTSHSKGRDVVLCLQRGDYLRRERDYYVQYVPTLREFRVHVAFGKVIRVQGKYLDKPELAKSWIRNYESGYRFRAPRKKLGSARLETAKNAVNALGLDFGAVDLLLGDDNLEYVLEVNTAPACSPLTAEAYVNAFVSELGISASQLNLPALRSLSQEAEDSERTEIEEEE